MSRTREEEKEERQLLLKNKLCTIFGCSNDRSEKNKWFCEKHRIQRILWQAAYREKLRYGHKICSTKTTVPSPLPGEGE